VPARGRCSPLIGGSERYDVRMGEPDSIATATLIDQARAMKLAAERNVVILAGRAYAERALAVATGRDPTGRRRRDRLPAGRAQADCRSRRIAPASVSLHATP
jgi:hypothetical protein